MPTVPTPPSSEPATDPWTPILAPLTRQLAELLAAPGAAPDEAQVANLLTSEGTDEWDVAIPLHRFAKQHAVAPPVLAARLAPTFPSVPGIGRAFATGPYLNFTVDRSWLTRTMLDLVRARGATYGHGPARSERACVEHTSANPTGPFHIGRIRNALIGDTFSRVLRAAGYPVTTHYYVDDLGRQAAIITWIWSKPISDWPVEVRQSVDGVDPTSEKPDHYLGRPYPPLNEYLKSHPEADLEVQRLTHSIETGHAPPEHRATVQKVLDGMLQSLSALGIRFDRFVWESELLTDGSVADVVERLARSPRATREENGALAIDAKGAGLPQDSEKIIVTRADGTTLYATRDVAYHLQKFRGFDRVIDVLGSNHQLHAKVLGVLLGEVGESRRPELVLYQYITAAGGGGMSTRKGTAVHLDDLLDEAVLRAHEEILKRRSDLTLEEREAISSSVASGAIRFHIVRIAADKTVGFRWEDAISFEGRTGPFVQYSYARASSILRKAEQPEPPASFDPALLTTKEEWALVRTLSRLPGLVDYVARTSHVHALAGYAYELAEEFNRFYQEVPVMKADAERASRLALVHAFRQVLGNTLDLLGIDRLDRM